MFGKVQLLLAATSPYITSMFGKVQLLLAATSPYITSMFGKVQLLLAATSPYINFYVRQSTTRFVDLIFRKTFY